MLKVFAKAKINLCLDVLDRDEISGYHQIQTIIQEVPALANEITIREADTQSAHPVTHLLLTHFQPKTPLEIEIKQAIPHSSGLGGHSSNCATLLKALNRIWQLNLSASDLQNFAIQLGMDVPFFLTGGTALAEGYGEKITVLPSLNLKFQLEPKGSPKKDKTAQAYKALDLKLCGQNLEKTTQALEKIRSGELSGLEGLFHNDFETITPSTKSRHLAGSGPSTFSL